MTKKLLMGNEAMAHAALEAGVRVVAGYPGTPSSEIVETVAKLHASGAAHGVQRLGAGAASNGDGDVNSRDATNILRAAARIGTGRSHGFTDEQFKTMYDSSKQIGGMLFNLISSLSSDERRTRK